MMSSTVHLPIFKRIEFDVNIVQAARIVMPGVLGSPRPVRSEAPRQGLSIASASTSRMGSEPDIAEIGSGTTETMASIALDLKDTYCHFTYLRQSGKGVVRSR